MFVRGVALMLVEALLLLRLSSIRPNPVFWMRYGQPTMGTSILVQTIASMIPLVRPLTLTFLFKERTYTSKQTLTFAKAPILVASAAYRCSRFIWRKPFNVGSIINERTYTRLVMW